jgi:hypothetical protein
MRAAILFLMTAAAGLAQLENDTITTTAQSADPGKMDQASVRVCVAAEDGVGLDEVLGAVQSLGISERNLVTAGADPGWYCPYPEPPKLYTLWQFTYSVPLTKIQQALAALVRAKAAPPPGLYMGYGVEAGWSAAAECALPTLLSQARRHAETVAAAAGLRVGAVVALSDGSTVDLSSGGIGTPMLAMVGAPMGQQTASLGCQVVAQFKLLR